MKPISAAILNIRGADPGTATIGNGATNLSKDIIRVANIAYNISQVEQKSGFLLVTGEKGFNKSACLHMLGQQISRVFSGKHLYPGVFISKDAASEFEKTISTHYKTLSGHIDLQQYTNDVNCGAAVGIVARQQENLILDEITLSAFKKVYITGHGAAGTNVLASGDSVFSAKQLVDFLVANKVLEVIKDIRISSCYSADKREPNSFKNEDIDKANRNAGFFERMVFGERDTFIERVANEIWSRGYTDVKVSGYHGAGVFYAGEIPFTHLRSTTIPPTITVKRKSVRVTLESPID
ncbi:hypothetical protein KAN62_001096 [Salmonella enterica subsp. enterica serovar Victoria]|nr:hypothetical protein [Salmonella enterica subsp. enterica serovar Victoria]EJX6163102.1 hypothetical protein [Salmonella enterica]EHJ7448661.1 hypothetical protein [Salmonella enterica subsp. enterica serovar Victoria]EJX9792339.1 hypothetical protein [Salmonella enterica]ELH0605396.1 hypothetical protein [Salmonella enterica]